MWDEAADFLGALSPRLRSVVEGRGMRRVYAAGDVIFHQDDPGETLFIIRQGYAGVTVGTSAGSSLLLNVLTAGQTFGEIALTRGNGVRSATVRAITKLEVLTLGRADLAHLRHVDSAFDRLLTAALASHVERLSQVILESRGASVSARCIRRLAQLCPTQKVGEVVLPLNQEQLGALVGVSRQTMNQALGRLEARGLVTRSKGQVTVVHASTMRRLARDVVI